MLLFLDTETTGLYHYDKRSDDPLQPKIVELAALLTDNVGKEYGAFNVLIDNDIDIPIDASNVHGITTDDCAKFGVYQQDALNLLASFVVRCTTIVGHNISFDMRMIRSAYGSEYYDRSLYSSTPKYCTMQNTTQLCKLPKAKGNGWKWPRLDEAYKIICGKDLEGGHRAMVDVRACRDIYFELIK